jgi:ABC-2 type transport system ATP-binding protein
MIHVENLTKYFDNFCAVDRISLDIAKGEILGLLGPNGAGKTTTLRMLTGYFPPTSGTIKVKEFNINEHSLEIKKRMGYLPESAPLYHSMLVYDYLDFIARIRGLAGDAKLERIRRLVDLCGLGGIMHKSVSELSKGLKQRVGLAHAMMTDPEILILDEPTSGLDPNQIVEIREIIRQIGREKTVILSTHILSEAEAACDRIVIINKGRIIADGSAEKLKHDAGEERIVKLSLSGATSDTAVALMEAIDAVERVEKTSAADDDSLDLRLTCRAETDPRKNIYQAIKNTDWILLEMQQETKTLETIFRELTI